VSGGLPAGLPAAFLAALADGDEVLVTSRSGAREVTVPMTIAVSPGGTVYVMTSAFSRKAERWDRDPWVRVAIPGTAGLAVEGWVHPVRVDELDAAAETAILDRFATAGAATPEALRQLLEAGTTLLLRVEVASESG
jgi:hypothetical protein